MTDIEDRIFGDLNTPESRHSRHLQGLAGVHHGMARTPISARPGEAVLLKVTTSGPRLFTGVTGWYSTGDHKPAMEGAFAVDFQRVSATWDDVIWGYVQAWEAKIPAQEEGAIVRYRIGAKTVEGDWVYADNQVVKFGEATDFAFLVTDARVPEWAPQALVYHIFIDRFNPGSGGAWLKPDNLSGFYGGTLRGVIERLDYIRDLGFNTIWLSPLFPSPSHHGYDATNYENVEPRLGTRADLDELIQAAHRRGLRVILDFVANHWSSLHPTFQAAQSDRNSPYFDWYIWKDWPDDYATYFNVRNLPRLNLRYGSPARDYLVEIACYWLKQGVDGFRLDHANGPPADFWVDFLRACRDTKPDCWLFGEIVHTAKRQASYAGTLDGLLDFHLAYALRQTFGVGAWGLGKFEAFLQAHEAYFPPGMGRPAFLDNHDMDRFLYLSDGDQKRLKLAALVLFTLGQPPIVYYGTEAGLSQERPVHQGDRGLFEEARLPMVWGDGQDRDLTEYFRRLIALRKAYPAFVEGDRRLVYLDETSGIYAYSREIGQERALVALNISDQSRSIKIPVPLSRDAQDRLNAQTVRLEAGDIILELAPESGALVS